MGFEQMIRKRLCDMFDFLRVNAPLVSHYFVSLVSLFFALSSFRFFSLYFPDPFPSTLFFFPLHSLISSHPSQFFPLTSLFPLLLLSPSSPSSLNVRYFVSASPLFACQLSPASRFPFSFIWFHLVPVIPFPTFNKTKVTKKIIRKQCYIHYRLRWASSKEGLRLGYRSGSSAIDASFIMCTAFFFTDTRLYGLISVEWRGCMNGPIVVFPCFLSS